MKRFTQSLAKKEKNKYPYSNFKKAGFSPFLYLFYFSTISNHETEQNTRINNIFVCYKEKKMNYNK